MFYGRKSGGAGGCVSYTYGLCPLDMPSACLRWNICKEYVLHADGKGVRKIAEILRDFCDRCYRAAMKFALLHEAEKAKHIVQIGYNHEQYQYAEAGIFGTYHERFARFAPRNHLIKQEKYMASVECRYG